MFDEIMDKIIAESGFTKEILRRGREIGRQWAKMQPHRDNIMVIVTHRLPQLQQAMQERLSEIADESLLHDLLIQSAIAPDEATARTAFGLPQP